MQNKITMNIKYTKFQAYSVYIISAFVLAIIMIMASGCSKEGSLIEESSVTAPTKQQKDGKTTIDTLKGIVIPLGDANFTIEDEIIMLTFNGNDCPDAQYQLIPTNISIGEEDENIVALALVIKNKVVCEGSKTHHLSFDLLELNLPSNATLDIHGFGMVSYHGSK